MKGFYHIWAWQPSWSCDLDFLYTHWFPLPIDASYKIWLWLAKRFQRRRSLKLWTDGRTTDGRTPDNGHPISSPCEPNGSGELKIYIPLHIPVLLYKSGVQSGVHRHVFVMIKWKQHFHSDMTEKFLTETGDNNTNNLPVIQADLNDR